MPSAENFDINDDFHSLIRDIIDQSYNDYVRITKELDAMNLDKIKSHELYHVYMDTKERWGPMVMSSSDVLIRGPYPSGND